MCYTKEKKPHRKTSPQPPHPKNVNYYSEILITLTFIASVVILTKVWSRRNKPKQLQGQNDLETILDGFDGKYVSIIFTSLGQKEATLILVVYDKRPTTKSTRPTEVYDCVHPKSSRLEIFEGTFFVRHTEEGGVMLQKVN